MADTKGKVTAPEDTLDGQDYRPQGTQKPGKRAHEAADLDVQHVFFALGILISIIVGAQFALKAYEHQLGAHPPEAGAVGSPLAPLAFGPQIPPAPRLQADPQQEMDTLKTEQTGLLNSYGWVGASHQIVHIPIEQAEQNLLKNGLPKVGPKPSPPAPLPRERPISNVR